MSRSCRLLLCLSVSILALSAKAEAHHRERIALTRGWTVRQLPDDGMTESASATPPSLGGGWFPATVPGDVHLDLLNASNIPDPFYRDNESKLQWIEKAGWEYRTSVEVTPATLSREHVELVFEGLDTACTLYLNGQRIATPNNMFHEWRIDVKSVLHTGSNDLHIVFPAPMKAAEAIAEKIHGIRARIPIPRAISERRYMSLVGIGVHGSPQAASFSQHFWRHGTMRGSTTSSLSKRPFRRRRPISMFTLILLRRNKRKQL